MLLNNNVAGDTGLTIRNIIQTLKARAFGVVCGRGGWLLIGPYSDPPRPGWLEQTAA